MLWDAGAAGLSVGAGRDKRRLARVVLRDVRDDVITPIEAAPNADPHVGVEWEVPWMGWGYVRLHCCSRLDLPHY